MHKGAHKPDRGLSDGITRTRKTALPALSPSRDGELGTQEGVVGVFRRARRRCTEEQNNGVVVGRESRQPDDGRWASGTSIRGWAAVFGVLLSGLNHHLESVWQSRDEASVRQMHVGV